MKDYITKSSLTAGLRCPRMLWLKRHKPTLAKPSPASEMNKSGGREFGNMFRLARPDGVLIGHVEQPRLAVSETSHLLASGVRKTLFEAAFEHEGLLVRADCMEPRQDNWALVEVKSSSSIKDTHMVDCAIQFWALEGRGIRIGQVRLAHVNGAFEYAGDGNYEGLLVEEDVTAKVRELSSEVPAWLQSYRDILAGREPQVRMSGRCDSCDFIEYCEQDLPQYPVAILPHGTKIVQQFLDEGIVDVRDIPEGRLENRRHTIVWNASRSNEVYVSKKLPKVLAGLAYPRHFLDFESINFLIPRWIGTRPNQHIPFQWSCHIENRRGAMEHQEFLSTDGAAPMRPFAESLINAVGGEGPIIVYGAFEQTILKQLIEFCPDLATPLRHVVGRLVDLLPLLRDHYYHPDMKGSWSIKAVLPTIAPHLDYSVLEEVQNGTMAQQAYMRIIDRTTPSEQRKQTIRNLLTYCQRDTLAMVEVVRFLQGIPNGRELADQSGN